MSSPRIKLSNSQTLILDGVETGILLSDLAQQLRPENADIPDTSLHLMLLVHLRLKTKSNTEQSGSLSKNEHQKLQNLFKGAGAVYGSVRNLVKASKLPETIFAFITYIKFTFASREFKRIKAFARFENDNWCMDFAYVDKLAKDKNCVKFLLLRQDLSDRTVDAKGMKTKSSKETFRAFLTMITKKPRPKKIWVDKATEFAGEFKKV